MYYGKMFIFYAKINLIPTTNGLCVGCALPGESNNKPLTLYAEILGVMTHLRGLCTSTRNSYDKIYKFGKDAYNVGYSKLATTAANR
jgi:hypothetical protein